ncbi:hypothetical protein [Azohydromonas sediminis]|uniref:hypothetical protein n=1 Tax=Azohydromonas sediminis TaxID=2259674 RepID=UPI001F2C9896|nr:hypothetical protein [Azohydromonas sediminis]
MTATIAHPSWRLAALALAAAALAGCRAPAGEALFPLDPGHEWTYRVTSERDDSAAVEHETLRLRTLGREALDDGPAWRRRSDDGVDYWLRADDSGIYRVASKSDLDAEPRPDAQRRYVLKAPYRVGTQWQAPTTTYLLRRRADFPPELRHVVPPVAMHYQIEATDEAVETPAGRFVRCLRVRGVASVHVFADSVAGWRDLPLVTTEWYCPGPGLVRLKREEPARYAFVHGGTLTMELVAWQ